TVLAVPPFPLPNLPSVTKAFPEGLDWRVKTPPFSSKVTVSVSFRMLFFSPISWAVAGPVADRMTPITTTVLILAYTHMDFQIIRITTRQIHEGKSNRPR